MANFSHAWKTLLLAGFIGSSSGQTCDIFTDPCPYQADGACDVELGLCPENSDCFDCDPCHQYQLDCGGCVANGCFYCASEGLCYSAALGEDYWNQIYAQSPKRTSCDTESEWATSCDVDPSNFFSDPLYSANQWIYDLLRVEDVWKQGYTGKGVMIRDASHPELSANFDVEASCEIYLPPEQQPGQDPNDHGTAVASLAVGGGNNGQCAVGIAPDATLSACVGPILLYDDYNPTFNFLDGLETTHVSVNSWGFDACNIHKDKDLNAQRGGGRFLQETACPFVGEGDNNPCVICDDLASPECITYIAKYCQSNGEVEHVACAEYLDTFMDCHFNVLSEPGQTALAKGVTEGRDGKGIVYMIAAGNEYEKWEDVNMEGWLNTRFTIVVAAVGKDGKHASYSTPGAAVFISGPGGDKENFVNNVVADLGSGCKDATIGTSFATPSVSGVVALMLQANPMLSWRDVQGILASTAFKTDAEDPSWTTNAAKMHHSNLYGFGLADATAAVEAAKKWITYGAEKQVTVDSGPVNVVITDDLTQMATSTITVQQADEDTTMIAEAVVVYLQLDYESRGDLEVILTSPLGTESVLSPGKRPENVHLQGDETWKLLTVRTYGENPRGDWTLTIRDTKSGQPKECVDFPYLSTNEDESVPGGLQAIGCNTMFQFCTNKTLIPELVILNEALDDETGMTPTEACCVCGGGGAPVSTVNALESWKIIVYGHENKVFVASQGNGGEIPSRGYQRRSTFMGAALMFGALALVLL